MRQMRVEDAEVAEIRARVRAEVRLREGIQQSPRHTQLSAYEQRCLEDDLRTLRGILHNLTTLNGWRGRGGRENE